MHENDRPVKPGEIEGERKLPKRAAGDIQPFPGHDVGEVPADDIDAKRGRVKPGEGPLDDPPAVEGP